jgi:hypothetical protein
MAYQVVPFQNTSHCSSYSEPAQLTLGKTHRLNPLPRTPLPDSLSQGSDGARVDLQAGASPSAQVEEQQPARTCKLTSFGSRNEQSPSTQVEEQQPAHITCKFGSFGSSNKQKASYFHSAHVLLIWLPWKVILRMTVCYFHLSPRESGQQTINKARGREAYYLIKY